MSRTKPSADTLVQNLDQAIELRHAGLSKPVNQSISGTKTNQRPCIANSVGAGNSYGCCASTPISTPSPTRAPPETTAVACHCRVGCCEPEGTNLRTSHSTDQTIPVTKSNAHKCLTCDCQRQGNRPMRIGGRLSVTLSKEIKDIVPRRLQADCDLHA